MFVQFKVEALGEGERERERARETELQAEKEKVFRGGALSLLYMDVLKTASWLLRSTLGPSNILKVTWDIVT